MKVSPEEPDQPKLMFIICKFSNFWFRTHFLNVFIHFRLDDIFVEYAVSVGCFVLRRSRQHFDNTVAIANANANAKTIGISFQRVLFTFSRKYPFFSGGWLMRKSY